MKLFRTKLVSKVTYNKKATVLLFTLMVITALTSVVAAYLGLVYYSTKSTGAQIAASQAIYLADAGLNKSIWYLKNTAPNGSTDGSWRTTAYPAAPGPNPTDPQQENFGNGTFTMWVQDSGSNVKIYSRGTVADLSRTVEQTVSIEIGAGDSITVTSQNDWSEM